MTDETTQSTPLRSENASRFDRTETDSSLHDAIQQIFQKREDEIVKKINLLEIELNKKDATIVAQMKLVEELKRQQAAIPKKTLSVEQAIETDMSSIEINNMEDKMFKLEDAIRDMNTALNKKVFLII